jgi:L-iditol 2-dehydrogenase
MKAYVLHQVNHLRYDDIDPPSCPKGWALVKVKAAGICSSDIPRIFTKGTYHFPTIPGHEFSGIVESVGSKEDEKLVGKHVGVFPLIPCFKCSQCHIHHYEMCENYDYVGSRRDGAFAEIVAVPIWNLIPLNKNIPFTSAAMLEPLSVALHALRQGHMAPGCRVGIVGTGMIGIAAGLWAKRLNASEVTIIGRSDIKRCLVERCGLNYSTATCEYDFVLEAVGTPTSISRAICMTTPGGSLVLMGNPSDDILMNQNVYWRILRKQLHVCGTWNSFYDGLNKSDWTESVEALNSGEFNVQPLISHCFKQDR